VAWCISSQETTEVVQMFFRAIKGRSPHVKVHTLMTDDGNKQNMHEIMYLNVVTDFR